MYVASFAACAHVFYEAGAKVILCARRVNELERVKKELQQLKLKVQIIICHGSKFTLIYLYCEVKYCIGYIVLSFNLLDNLTYVHLLIILCNSTEG